MIFKGDFMKRKLLLILTLCIFTICSVFAFTACKASNAANNENNPPAHNYGEWIIEKEPTCTKIGRKYHICTDEDCNNMEWEAIPMVEHTINEVAEINTDEHVFKCTVCNSVIKAETHTFANGICTVCQYQENTTVGLRYALNEDKQSYSIIGIGTATCILYTSPSPRYS